MFTIFFLNLTFVLVFLDVFDLTIFLAGQWTNSSWEVQIVQYWTNSRHSSGTYSLTRTSYLYIYSLCLDIPWLSYPAVIIKIHWDQERIPKILKVSKRISGYQDNVLRVSAIPYHSFELCLLFSSLFNVLTSIYCFYLFLMFWLLCTALKSV